MLHTSRPEMPGVSWNNKGFSSISGYALGFLEKLDELIVNYALSLGARQFMFSPLIDSSMLKMIKPEDNDNLTHAEGEVLLPEACCHIYVHNKNNCFQEPHIFTTKNTCFRVEEHYTPLERQQSFTMREIVILGKNDEVRTFLIHAQAFLDTLSSQLNLATHWQSGDDPFFQTQASTELEIQLPEPAKNELIFENRFALASANFHHKHLGQAFSINREVSDGIIPVSSGCISIGLERWLSAMFHQHGSDTAIWPNVNEIQNL